MTNTETKTMTKTNTFREHLQRAILETCDLWDIWSEWWGDMTWPTKRQRQRQTQTQRQPWKLVTFETLITILTIENLNSWKSVLPDNKEWQHSQFLRCLGKSLRKHTNSQSFALHHSFCYLTECYPIFHPVQGNNYRQHLGLSIILKNYVLQAVGCMQPKYTKGPIQVGTE